MKIKDSSSFIAGIVFLIFAVLFLLLVFDGQTSDAKFFWGIMCGMFGFLGFGLVYSGVKK